MSQSDFREKLQEYFHQLEIDQTEEIRNGRVLWRMICFDRGLDYANYLNDNFFPLEGQQVIDVACAWGGHSLAFATKGANVIGSDLNNHQFDKLSQFADNSRLNTKFVLANCEEMPFTDSSADVMLALDLIEHISHPDKFASEVARVLKPGGVCVITTPARLRSFLLGEPHWGLRGLAAFPFAIQPKIARGIFRKDYPFQITKQYGTAQGVIDEFTPYGLTGRSTTGGIIERLGNKSSILDSFLKKFFWKLILISKP